MANGSLQEIKCIECGACCYGLTLTDKECDISGIDKSIFKLPINPESVECKVNGACSLLDKETNKCTDYKNRPSICKNFNCWENTTWLQHFMIIYRIATENGNQDFNSFVKFVDNVCEKLGK